MSFDSPNHLLREGVKVESHPSRKQDSQKVMEGKQVFEGTLSPLLANIVLDELDKELERRGHRFCRYADDCNIYVKSQKAGERVWKA